MKNKFKLGDYVALNALDDATIWLIVGIDRHEVLLVDATDKSLMTSLRPQHSDVSLLRKPTPAQLKNWKG